MILPSLPCYSLRLRSPPIISFAQHRPSSLTDDGGVFTIREAIRGETSQLPYRDNENIVTVAIKKIDKDVAAAVSEAMDLASYRDFIPKSSPLFLKVNLGWDLFLPGSVTNPAVFEAVVKKLKGHGAPLCVVESDQVLENVEKAYGKSRISEIARRHGISWINLSRQKLIMKSIPENRIIKNVTIPEILTQGTILTLPVMKTHNKSAVTLSLKNQWGCIPKMRHMYHLVLDEAIADVNVALGVKFAVVDGTIGMEGNAPKTGIPREVGIVGAGSDLVEIDSVFARLMGLDPRAIPHIVEAARRGLGKIGKDWVGDRMDPIRPFLPARHNVVSRWELLLRKSIVSRLIFRPPIFPFMLLGSKLYYHAFDLTRGRRIRKAFLTHPLYGPYFRNVGGRSGRKERNRTESHLDQGL
jgi:uncharacterized protein (DUF362 family)